MPKDWFKLENLTPLASIPKGGKIHFIGVCGVAMGQLAVALSERGYQVSGSDKEFYEPMGSFLSSSNAPRSVARTTDSFPLVTLLDTW